MRYICGADFEEVISEWANREGCNKDQIMLNRMPLINRLPLDTTWVKAAVEKEDIPSLKLIKETGWNDLSFFTGDMQIAARNVEIFSKVKLVLPDEIISAGLTRQQYFDRFVQSLSKFRSQGAVTGHNLTLILIGSCQDRPYTILEGNHTAIGLYFKYFIDAPQLQYPSHCAYNRYFFRNDSLSIFPHLMIYIRSRHLITSSRYGGSASILGNLICFPQMDSTKSFISNSSTCTSKLPFPFTHRV